MGLVGANGSGKSSVCTYLNHQGFYTLSLSNAVRAEATRLGLDHSRESLIQTGNQLKNQWGLDILAKRSIELASAYEKVVFDSIRHPAEARYLQQAGVVLIGVTAPLELRYARIKKRQRETDFIDFDTFCEQDAKENTGVSSGQHIQATLQLCTYRVVNDQDLVSLEKEILHILEKESIHV